MPETPPKNNIWWKLVHLNPALYRSFIMATFLLLGSLGVSIATDIPDAVLAWVSVVLLIIQGVWTDRATEAKARVVVTVPDPINAPDTVAPGPAVTTASSTEIVQAARTVKHPE